MNLPVYHAPSYDNQDDRLIQKTYLDHRLL